LSDFEHWKRQTWKTKAGWNTSCFFLNVFLAKSGFHS
jgi:hypothetical protein